MSSKILMQAAMVGGVRHKSHKNRTHSNNSDVKKVKSPKMRYNKPQRGLKDLPTKQKRKSGKHLHTIQQPTPTFHFSKETPNR